MICRAYRRQPGLGQPNGHCLNTSSVLGSPDPGGLRSVFLRNSHSEGGASELMLQVPQHWVCLPPYPAPQLCFPLWHLESAFPSASPPAGSGQSSRVCPVDVLAPRCPEQAAVQPEPSCQLGQDWPGADLVLYIWGGQLLIQGLLNGGARSTSQQRLCLLPSGSLASGPPLPAHHPESIPVSLAD